MDKEEYEVSFPRSATAFDLNGNVIKCDMCENPAGMSMLGEKYSLHRCIDHPFYENIESARFVYRPPTEDHMRMSKEIKTYEVDLR